MVNQVDVVIPCYNYAHFLQRCVDSALDQHGVDVRVLIIDDASSDETQHIGSKLAALDSRVEFLSHAVNQGHIATYNEGLLGWASAKYSLLLSADDALAPGALERASSLMNKHPDVGMTYGMALLIDDKSEILAPGNFIVEDYQIISSEQFLRRCCVSGNPVPTPTAVVRTELQHKLGGYRAGLPHSGDMEMWMRFAVHGAIGVVHPIQAYYRLHSSNMSSNYYDGALSDRRERINACEEVFTRWGDRFPDFSKWMQAMYQRMGEEVFWIASEAFDEGRTDMCRACLEFAHQVYPEIHNTSMWHRLRLKTLLGSTVWHRIRPVIRAVRGIPDRKSIMPAAPTRFRRGQQIGWWPA